MLPYRGSAGLRHPQQGLLHEGRVPYYGSMGNRDYWGPGYEERLRWPQEDVGRDWKRARSVGKSFRRNDEVPQRRPEISSDEDETEVGTDEDDSCSGSYGSWQDYVDFDDLPASVLETVRANGEREMVASVLPGGSDSFRRIHGTDAIQPMEETGRLDTDASGTEGLSCSLQFKVDSDDQQC